MATIRLAVASTPLAAGVDESVEAAIAAVEEAARQEAAIVCLPETTIPGHRCQARPVADVSNEELGEAIGAVAAAARRAAVVTIVGTENVTARGREIVAVVLGADGSRIGEQVKTQIDPSEERDYVPGSGRRVFTAAGCTFGIAICHEAFRYPEIARSLALAGAQVVFAPHWVVTEDGSLPSRWRDPTNSYHESALMLRALENTIYVAQANCAGTDQGSITGVVDPGGVLVAGLPYGKVGVVTADVDLEHATRHLALRWRPERSLVHSAVRAGTLTFD